jgi:hypothetical protein
MNEDVTRDTVQSHVVTVSFADQLAGSFSGGTPNPTMAAGNSIPTELKYRHASSFDEFSTPV